MWWEFMVRNHQNPPKIHFALQIILWAILQPGAETCYSIEQYLVDNF